MAGRDGDPRRPERRGWEERVGGLLTGPFRDLWDLFVKGGITVETPAAIDAIADAERKIYIRTVIQPDGDVLTLLNTDFHADDTGAEAIRPVLIGNHLAQVRARVRRLPDLFESTAARIGRMAPIGAIVGLSGAGLEGMADPAFAALDMLWGGVIGGVGLPTARWAGGKALVWWLKGKLKAYVDI